MSKPIPGKVIVIVAPSGAGKTTIAQRLLKDYPKKIKFSVSATTRPPRKNETQGEDYYFLSEEEFIRKIKNEEFLEWEFYGGNRYGTLRSEVDKLVESGYFPLLDIEVKGALNVQKLYNSDAISIFIQPPSMDELENRLTNRGSETDKTLLKRLERAKLEMEYVKHFDYSVVNDDLESAYAEVKKIVEPFITDKS